MSSPQVHAEVKELLNRPAGQPPVGAVPNFHNPPNLDTVFVTTATLCAGVAALAVLIRSYTKLVLIRSTAYEDCQFAPSISKGEVPTEIFQTL